MKLTREGKRFSLATCLIALAALNTGNNLIYLILAMMLSILAISFAALKLNLRGLALRAVLRKPVYAGQDAEMTVSVLNGKFLPSYSLELRLPEGMSGGGAIDYVPASGSAKAELRVRFDRRGAYSLGEMDIASSFPFIFLEGKVRAASVGDVTVYPRLVRVGGVMAMGGSGRSTFSMRPGRGDDFLSIREFRHGDDMKLISWKASARAQGLMVREFAEEQPRTVTVFLDDGPPFSADVFERAVSYAASLSLRLIREGYLLRLVTARKVVPFGGGPEHLYKVLDVLAVASEVSGKGTFRCEDGHGATVLVLKSAASELGAAVSSPDMVVDASRL